MTKERGTGLDLSVCYRIAQRHQATLEVETSANGTAFHFIFNHLKSHKCNNYCIYDNYCYNKGIKGIFSVILL